MNKKDINQIYKENVTIVYKFIYCLTHDADIAEELTQETFFQAIKGIDRFERRCKISVWLCEIAKKLWYKELAKKNKHTNEELNENIVSNEDVEGNYFQNLNKVEIFKALHNLDEDTREVMYLRLSGELKFSEIAEIMGRNENWARVTFYRGKQKLIKERNK